MLPASRIYTGQYNLPAMGKPTSPWQVPGDRERRRELKRDAVILAAARAFRERGYHNTSLDDIAALLHVTKPTLYYYVSNKEQMLFECFREGLGRVASACGEARGAQASGGDVAAHVSVREGPHRASVQRAG